jgi:predicted membrane protein (TIGR00267 family)
MRYKLWLASPRTRLDIVAGIVDGILTALTLTAAKLLDPIASLDMSLAFRVSVAAGATTIFVFFVAHYAELRTQLSRAEHQLNVLRHGRLAASNLGKQVFREALAGAALAAFCSVVGAMFPIILALALPSPAWIDCAVAVLALGVLGVPLASSFDGSPARWSGALVVGGIALTFLGAALKITG